MLFDFSESYFVSIDENIVGYPKQMEKGTFALRSNGFTNQYSWATSLAYSHIQVDETFFLRRLETKYLSFEKRL